MTTGRARRGFSALQRAENSSIYNALRWRANFARSFSALQRAENSSIKEYVDNFIKMLYEFQCSSASRKFLNAPRGLYAEVGMMLCFSALQRAENSSIDPIARPRTISSSFSALQRAENSSMHYEPRPRLRERCFSALQRAENSSIRV